jgi:hypothetical protein
MAAEAMKFVVLMISPMPQKREMFGAVFFVLLGRTPKNGAPIIRA